MILQVVLCEGTDEMWEAQSEKEIEGSNYFEKKQKQNKTYATVIQTMTKDTCWKEKIKKRQF